LGEIDVSLDEIPHFDKDPEYKKIYYRNWCQSMQSVT
jgi:hypothetical protein